MIRKRTIATLTALGGFSAAIALLSGLPSAKADELSDLRANQDLLQQRIDQLAQANFPPFPTKPAAGGTPALAGSFPRSFLIPGTDTSIRIGGFGIGRVTWYLRGVQPSADLFGQGTANADRTEGGGGTGNLPNIPLKGGASTFPPAFAAGSTFPTLAPVLSHTKSEAFFISGKSSRIFIDARTPTAWGAAQAYIEFDFNTSNNNVLLNGQFGVVPNNPARFRQGYAALGPVLLGVATGSFVDNDSDIETIDDGGQVGGPGRSREAQLRYTWATPWPGVTVIGALEENVTDLETPNGKVGSDYTSAVTTASCANGGTSTGGIAAAGTPINIACAPLGALFNPAVSREPAGTFNIRFDQPWGHLRVGGVVRDAVIDDGLFLDKTYIGYGGTVSGDVKPFPQWSPKDDIGFSFTAGEGIGGYIPNASAVATNFGGELGGQNPIAVGGMTGGGSFNTFSAAGLAARHAYDNLVRGATITAFAAKLGYQHWWTDELRTNVDFSMIHQDVPSILIGPSTAAVAGVAGANARATSNKELEMAHINLLWSPVAFVTTGVEYSWGHRVVVDNQKGDSHIIQGMLRVNF